MRPLIFDGFSVTHDGEPLSIDQSFTATPGQRLAFPGKSGSGQFTVLKLAAGQLLAHPGTTQPRCFGLFNQHLLVKTVSCPDAAETQSGELVVRQDLSAVLKMYGVQPTVDLLNAANTVGTS